MQKFFPVICEGFSGSDGKIDMLRPELPPIRFQATLQSGGDTVRGPWCEKTDIEWRSDSGICTVSQTNAPAL